MQHRIPPNEHGPLGSVMSSAVSTCVHCGFCLAACPTYQQLGQETDSPRGRIILMKEVLEGRLPIAEALPHVDACLGCLACEPACPSGVLYRDLISPFRTVAEEQRRRTVFDRIRRATIQLTLPYPRRFRLAVGASRIAKPFSKLLPSSLRAMLELLPGKLPAVQRWKEVNSAVGTRRARVALLTGCAQSVLGPDINTATIDVLTRNGVEVVVPAGQTCCGALSWHVGNLAQARKFAEQNLQAFPADVDAVVTNAAGCGSGMHEYHLILKGTSHELRAEQFRHRVQDVCVFLDGLGELKPIADPGMQLRVAYHDACHLAHAQGVHCEPRRLLGLIPRLEVQEVADGHLCCGSAGTYNIDQPKLAHALGAQKAAHILATTPDIVATGNIGCLTQLTLHLSQAGQALPVYHTMQILRDAYDGRLSKKNRSEAWSSSRESK